jgi:hypothetical protein
MSEETPVNELPDCHAVLLVTECLYYALFCFE